MAEMNEIELEFISDIDMYLFVKKRMRGGVYYIAKRYNKANNEYMKSHDNSKSSKYIMHLDVNNLNG